MSLRQVFNKSALRKVLVAGISVAALSGCATTDQTENQSYDTKNNSAEVTESSAIYKNFMRDIMAPWKVERDENPSNRGKGHFYYTLNTEVSFDDYPQDQQFAMLTDYADRFLHLDHKSTYMKETYGENDCYASDDLRYIVENKFPQTEQMRLNMPDRRQEVLTNNEIAFVKNFFDAQIDTSIVKKHFEAIACKTITATTSSKEQLSFYGKDNHSDDYALEESNYNFGTFIHEITHIWQRQNDGKYTDGRAGKMNTVSDYNYISDKERSFTEYNNEQQGAIVEDYARYFLHQKKETWILDITEKNLSTLKNIVETQFPSAKLMRKYYEENGKLPTHIINTDLNAGKKPQNKQSPI